MSDDLSLSATVHGKVQGVYFRAFVRQEARSLGLTGWVRNLPGGRSVEVHAEGPKHALVKLEQALRRGPGGARIEEVKASWAGATGEYTDFSIRH